MCSTFQNVMKSGFTGVDMAWHGVILLILEMDVYDLMILVFVLSVLSSEIGVFIDIPRGNGFIQI